ncbi:MAG: GNAT family N-acetyltransferase [Candidatus Bathyarchaeia archaeon]
MKKTKMQVRVEDVDESNIEDLIYVCSSKRLGDPIHQEGVNLKRLWLREMLHEYGSCGKIAYYDEKPVAQILYFPEEADRTKASRRKSVLVLHCIYNPVPAAQKMGIGKKLVRSVIEDAKQRKTCLSNKPCRFIVAKAFDAGEFLPMPEFYRRCGFASAADNGKDVLYLPIEDSYEPAVPTGEYEPLERDRDRAVIFYGPICQFGYPFAKATEELVREVAPEIKVEMINEWEHPQESIERKNRWLVINAKPIRTFFMDTENFKKEVREALG